MLKSGIGISWVVISVALWWLVFALPMMLWVRERAIPKPRPRGTGHLSAAFGRLRCTLRQMKRFPELVKFLIAYLIYNDGIETVILSATIFGSDVVHLGLDQLALFILMIQGTAFVGSLLFAFLTGRMGNKRAVMVTLVVWSAVVLWAWRMPLFGNIVTEYWILGIIAGS